MVGGVQAGLDTMPSALGRCDGLPIFPRTRLAELDGRHEVARCEFDESIRDADLRVFRKATNFLNGFFEMGVHISPVYTTVGRKLRRVTYD